ncbi:MAG: peptidoglycan bridge formation glycyltransferase FemA/FemB family protein [Patescibacteria group bacterium]|jgi:lipid II:glycine glycyltransferase (peptidoglycan interpeptide bridge formation enzyme)
MEIKEIIDEKVWQDFEGSCAPHTFLQTWEWGAAQELLGHKIFRLGIFEKGNIRGTAFVYRINARRGSFLFCPHGPSVSWQDPEDFRALAGHLRALAKKEKVSFIRVSSLAPDTEEMGKLFKTEGFIPAPVHMMHPENAWILNINRPEEEILGAMKKRTRYSIRKAEKDGIKITTSANPEDVKLFYGMYLETAKRQKFIPFSESYIRREFEIFKNNNKALMFFAYFKGKLISAAVIIFSSGMAFYHHGASIRSDNSGLTASELLQWNVILEARRRGLKNYNFWGIAPENAKKHPWRGLTIFKKGFGGRAENYLHAQDLVISPKYWLNYVVETLRRVKRGY